MEHGNSSPPEASGEALYFAICEDRSFLGTLFHEWLEARFPCRLLRVSHPSELRTAEAPVRLVFVSTRISPTEGSILPKRCKGAPIIFDDNFTPRTAVWWKERGAKGLLDFRDSPEEWLHCIHQVLEGRSSATPTVNLALETQDSKHGLQHLSPREMQVAQMLVRGSSAQQVAKKLGTTEGTIKNQRKAIYQKLKIVRATQLPWAMGNGVRGPD